MAQFSPLVGNIECLLVADDLTGACDAAVQFRLRGAPTLVHMDVNVPQYLTGAVRAFVTETRDADEGEIEFKINQIAALTAKERPRIIFKKIDSLMRGNPGREILTAFDAFGCDVAIITPSFPEMGRTVRDGNLELANDNAWKPLHVPSLLERQGLAGHRHSNGLITEEINRGCRFIGLDITSQRDLESAVREALSTGLNILWAGSAGLAAALADSLYRGEMEPEARLPSHLPVLFCIGSDHAVTQGQVSALHSRFLTNRLDAGADVPESVATALESGAHTVLSIPRNQLESERLKTFFEHTRGLASAVLLSGGDTASAFCRSVGAGEIELFGEIVTGLPWGGLRGGLLDELPIATKSGAFGREDALIRVANFFTCPKD